MGIEHIAAAGCPDAVIEVGLKVIGEHQLALDFKELAVTEVVSGGDGQFAVAFGQAGNFVARVMVLLLSILKLRAMPGRAAYSSLFCLEIASG